MNGIVEIYNCPEDAYGYIVCRLSGRELWYWGCYDTKQEALEVADEFENGLVVMRDV
jgi:hypothetical protein